MLRTTIGLTQCGIVILDGLGLLIRRGLLPLAIVAFAMSQDVALAQGPITNGATHTGVIPVGGLDTWTFQAAINDSITIRIGEVPGTGTDPQFIPRIRLLGPDGASLGDTHVSVVSSTNDGEIDVRAPLTGTYTVLVSSDTIGNQQLGPGSYILTVAKTPGPYTISSGDEGGPMTNGATHTGVILVGDLDTWTIQATINDSITVRIGEVLGTGTDPLFIPRIRLRGPDGASLGDTHVSVVSSTNDGEIDVRAPLTGTYTVLVSSDTIGNHQLGPGSYILTVAKTPGPYTISPADEGGPMTNGATHTGVILVGDLDTWTIQATINDSITVRIGEVPGTGTDPLFIPRIRLRGPDGASLGDTHVSVVSSTNDGEIDVRAPLTGTYTVLVSSDTIGNHQLGPGSYILTVAKTPGPYTISSGDEGGPMTNGATHTGVILVGDLDTWTFQAAQNNSITVRIGEVTGTGADPLFIPRIRLRGPDGASLGDTHVSVVSSTNDGEIDVRAPLTGTYTVLVSSDTIGNHQLGPGSYILTVAGVPPQTPPPFLSAVRSSATSTTLSWTAVPGATSYNLKRSVIPGVEVLVRSGILATSVVDPGLIPATTYYYVVSAVNAAGESANSNEASVRLFTVPHVSGDFDGDGKADITVFRPSNGTWFIKYSSTGNFVGIQWGNANDVVVPGDYDGDGKIDVAIFRPSNGTWFIVNSSTGGAVSIQWGNGNDRPVPGDYDGDGRTDVAVFRPSTGTWFIVNSSTGGAVSIQWGNANDRVVPADYDGDGKTDIAVFRPSNGTWFIVNSSTGLAVGVQWGNGSDVAVPGDYDGDGKTDIAVFRPSTGTWFIQYSSTGTFAGVQWGNGLDVPVPGDYDGDGKTDIAVFRPSNGTWFIVYSSTGTFAGVQWGNGADIPILKR